MAPSTVIVSLAHDQQWALLSWIDFDCYLVFVVNDIPHRDVFCVSSFSLYLQEIDNAQVQLGSHLTHSLIVVIGQFLLSNDRNPQLDHPCLPKNTNPQPCARKVGSSKRPRLKKLTTKPLRKDEKLTEWSTGQGKLIRVLQIYLSRDVIETGESVRASFPGFS